MKYNDVLILVERMSKEQQEAGQREMAKRDLEPFIRLKKYFVNKWKNTGIEGLKNKKIELERYKEIIRDSVKESKLTSPELKEFLKKEMGFNPKFKVEKNPEYFSFAFDDETFEKKILLNKDYMDSYSNYNGIYFKNADKIRPLIKKFLIGHEYGHLYDFLKRYIETGKKDTVDTSTGKDEEVENSEGSANAYSIDNMYRKDRSNLLSKAGKIPPEMIEYSKDKKLNDLYYNGTVKKSKYFNKIIRRNNGV